MLYYFIYSYHYIYIVIINVIIYTCYLYTYTYNTIIINYINKLNFLVIYIHIISYPITSFINFGTYSSTRKSTSYYLASLSPLIVSFQIFRSQKVTKRLHRIKLVLFRVPAGVHCMMILWILFLYFLICLHLGLFWCIPWFETFTAWSLTFGALSHPNSFEFI